MGHSIIFPGFYGLLYYYGVMSLWTLKMKMEDLTGQEIDILEFINVTVISP
jgi:hypothetical protein